MHYADGFTSFDYYRPTPPPAIGGPALGRFVLAFEALGLTAPEGSLLYEISHGRRVDQNDRPAAWIKGVDGGLGVRETVPWDVQERCASLAELAERLAALEAPVYRAFIALGRLAPRVRESLRREQGEPSAPELDFCHLEIGPIEAANLQQDGLYPVGWMSVSFSGAGRLSPRPLRWARRRLEARPGIGALMELCRDLWPVRRKPPSRRLRRYRGWMGSLWPYGDRARPLDWYWGMHETGDDGGLRARNDGEDANACESE